MDRQESGVLEALAGAMERLLDGDVPQRLECPVGSHEALGLACEAANRLIATLTQARPFLLALAEGRLAVEAPPRNLLLSPFKQLQSNLRHLTWQTQQIIRGDLNQRVDFLGEFSTAFNAMIESLREKKVVEVQLRRSEKELRDITSALGEGVCVLDAEGRLTFMNPEAERLLGWTAADLQGKSLQEAVHFRKEDGAPIAAADSPLLHTLRWGETVRVPDDAFTRRDGSLLPVAFVVTPVLEEGKVTGAVIAFHDTSAAKRSREALERANELLSRQATTDALTGIPNRLLFNATLERDLNNARRHGFPLSVILFDIDHFKRINDTFGHGIGDLVLRELAVLVSAVLRQGDVLARWGGEEFTILLPHTRLRGGAILSERLRDAIERNTFSTVRRLTCSFGVAQLRSGESQKELLERADRALYRAKEAGRNRAVAAEA